MACSIQRRTLSSVVLGLLLPVTACGQSSPAPTTDLSNAARTSIESIEAASVGAHMEYLASDELAGRDTPSEGLEAAAAYLAETHASNGVEPGGPDGSYLQRYPFRLVGYDADRAEVRIEGPGGVASPVVGRDAFTDGGSTEPVSGAVTYVRIRPGATPEPGSLAGRIALFELPGSWGESLWFEGLDQAAFAREAGAVASIHVLDGGFPSSAIGDLQGTLAAPQWRVGDDELYPRAFVREGILADAGISPPWENPDPGWDDLDVVSVEVDGVSASTWAPLDIRMDGAPANVLAVVPGRDPDLGDEYVVLSAHYDHVGVGAPVAGDSIYNGADDNASGTSALLEIARVLASLPEEAQPRRSILFAHVSGEEHGLLGSEWWVENPTVPLGQVVANVNMDMIAGNTHPDTIAVLGRDYSSLGADIAAVNAAHPEIGIATAPDLWPQEGLFFRSDQFNFMRAEIPAIFLFAGFHDCYHRPCDEIDFVSPDKAARVARLVAYTVLEIANRDGRPRWDPDGLEEVRRLTSGAP